MRYTIEGLKAISKIRKIPPYVPFYSCEVGLDGGEINSLAWNHFIVPTGNVRESFIHLYDDHYKKVETKQWIVNTKDADKLWQRVDRDLTELYELLKSFSD